MIHRISFFHEQPFLFSIEKMSGQILLLYILGLFCFIHFAVSCPCCKDGNWNNLTDFEYCVGSEAVSYSTANYTCQRLGAVLTSIDDELEQNFLVDLTNKSGEYWVGLYTRHPRPKEKGSGWFWLDGTNYDVSKLDKWADGEPTGGHVDNCARLLAKEHCWRDIMCSRQYDYICKRKLCQFEMSTGSVVGVSRSDYDSATIDNKSEDDTPIAECKTCYIPCIAGIIGGLCAIIVISAAVLVLIRKKRNNKIKGIFHLCGSANQQTENKYRV